MCPVPMYATNYDNPNVYQERISLVEASSSSSDFRDIYTALSERDDSLKEKDIEIRKLKVELVRLQQLLPQSKPGTRSVPASPIPPQILEATATARSTPSHHPSANIRKAPTISSGDSRRRSPSRNMSPGDRRREQSLSRTLQPMSYRTRKSMAKSVLVLSPKNTK